MSYIFTDVFPSLLCPSVVRTMNVGTTELVSIDQFVDNPHAPPSYIETRLKETKKAYKFITGNALLSLEFLERNWKEHSVLIQQNPHVPESFFRGRTPLIWKVLTNNPSISDEFIMENVDSYVSEIFGMKWGEIPAVEIPEDAIRTRRIPNVILMRWKDYIPWYFYCDSRYVSIDILRHLVVEDKKREATSRSEPQKLVSAERAYPLPQRNRT